jgi:hypothetical protein
MWLAIRNMDVSGGFAWSILDLVPVSTDTHANMPVQNCLVGVVKENARVAF